MHSELMVRSRLGRGNVEVPAGATHLIKVGQTVSQTPGLTENKFGFFNFNSDRAGAIYPKYYNNQPIAYLYSSDQSDYTHVNLLTENGKLGDLTARYLGRSDTKQIAIQETDAWEMVLFTQSDVGKMIPIWLSTEIPPWAYQYNVTCMIENSPLPNNSAKFKFVFVDGSEETHSAGYKLSIVSTKILSYIETTAVPNGINRPNSPSTLSDFTQKGNVYSITYNWKLGTLLPIG